MPIEFCRRSAATRALRLVSCALLLLVASAGQAIESDGSLWATVSIQEQLSERISVGLLVQPRFSNNISKLERLLIRPSVSWQATEHWSVALGYDAHLIEHPRDRVEQRIWQQLAARHELATLPVGHRLRLEQRFIEGTGGTVVAGRYRLGVSFPLRERLRFELAAEPFVNFNDLRDGPAGGFEQNRVTGDFRFSLREGRAVTLGYMNQYLRRRGDDALFHVLTVGFHWGP